MSNGAGFFARLVASRHLTRFSAGRAAAERPSRQPTFPTQNVRGKLLGMEKQTHCDGKNKPTSSANAVGYGGCRPSSMTTASEPVGAVLATARGIFIGFGPFVGCMDRFADQDSTGRCKNAPYRFATSWRYSDVVAASTDCMMRRELHKRTHPRLSVMLGNAKTNPLKGSRKVRGPIA